MSVQSINPQLLPGRPLTKREHTQSAWFLGIAIIIALTVYIAYKISTPAQVYVQLGNPETKKDLIMSSIAQTPSDPAPEEYVNVVSSSISSTPKTPVTQSRRAVVSEEIQ